MHISLVYAHKCSYLCIFSFFWVAASSVFATEAADDGDNRWWDIDLTKEEEAALKIVLCLLVLVIACGTLAKTLLKVWHPSKGSFGRFELGVLAASLFMRRARRAAPTVMGRLLEVIECADADIATAEGAITDVATVDETHDPTTSTILLLPIAIDTHRPTNGNTIAPVLDMSPRVFDSLLAVDIDTHMPHAKRKKRPSQSRVVASPRARIKQSRGVVSPRVTRSKSVEPRANDVGRSSAG